MIHPEDAARMAGKTQHALDQMQGIINRQTLEIATLKAQIEAEIDWHEAEARQHREAAEDAHPNDLEDGWMHNTEATHHEIAAMRLADILKPQGPTDDIQF